MVNTNYLIRTMVNPLMEYSIVADTKGKLGNKVIAEGIFQKCDEANANGMSFSRNILGMAVDSVSDKVKDRHFLGELDHPDDIKDINRIALVSLKNISHVITSLELDGNYVVGKFETLDTPSGLILGSLLKDNIKTGISIRAITDQDVSYDTGAVDDIQEFTLISYDAVHNPAYSDAYVKSIMSSVYKLNSDYNNNSTLMTEAEVIETIKTSVTAAFKRMYTNSKKI